MPPALRFCDSFFPSGGLTLAILFPESLWRIYSSGRGSTNCLLIWMIDEGSEFTNQCRDVWMYLVCLTTSSWRHLQVAIGYYSEFSLVYVFRVHNFLVSLVPGFWVQCFLMCSEFMGYGHKVFWVLSSRALGS